MVSQDWIEDPNARERWILMKCSHTKAPFTQGDMRLLYSVALRLKQRVSNKFSIEISSVEKDKLEQLAHWAAVGEPKGLSMKGGVQ